MGSIKTTNITLRKDLGQYFSGNRVAKLLAHLSDFQSANSIIDPMCGSGDMLRACLPENSIGKIYMGFEIDDKIVDIARKNFETLSNTEIIQGNVFSINSLTALAQYNFDLVITNPPYVRYQTIAKLQDDNLQVLKASEIRSNLLSSLGKFNHINTYDSKVFQSIIESYSGLSDIAVPSWILCALLVRKGGRIAMVVPQTWLNRNYADIIQYLLLKLFKIEYIVEDANSSWFQNAQVKTTLLVAKRISSKERINSWGKEGFIYCKIFSTACTENSLVGNIDKNTTNPEKKFVEMVKKKPKSSKYFSTTRIPLHDFSLNLLMKISDRNWFRQNEDLKVIHSQNNIRVPSELAKWINGVNKDFISLTNIGISVSQGLRTGANSFFYLEILDINRDYILARPSKKHNISEVVIPIEYIKYVIRKQSEIPNSFSLENLTPSGVLLYIQSSSLKKDMPKELLSEYGYKSLSGSLAEYVSNADAINIGTTDYPKSYKELSAVKPNIRKWNQSKPTIPPRFWYMIPKLTKRHYPDLFIPRVNGRVPITRINSKKPYVIDANFSSIWISDLNSEYDNFSVLALLNSSWCTIAMEEYGTVLGGGALKLEATQIKKLPIPKLNSGIIRQLSVLGKLLVESDKSTSLALKEIDYLIIKQLGFKKDVETKYLQLLDIKKNILSQRNNNEK